MWRQILGTSTLFVLTGMPVLAQVTADGTAATIVNGGTPYSITGGTQQLTTLFHSFSTFSPGTANVSFDLDGSQSNVDLVIGRVTGGNASWINGQLAVTGGNSPDLFLINPTGITFGSNASLSLAGSFLASSADSVTFANGTTFAATDPDSAPILTISRPIGLQFSSGISGPITVQDNGHAVASVSPIFAPYMETVPAPGLRVSTGETLSLVGNSINLEGGLLKAPGGTVELGSVAAGDVMFDWQPQGFTLSYAPVNQFSDIHLTQRSLVDASGAFGVNAGSIQLQGQQIHIEDGSLVWNQNRGLGSSGNVTVQASEALTLSGSTPMVTAVSGIISETVFNGAAGEVKVTAPWLTVQNGAAIASRTVGAGSSGDVIIHANHMQVRGYVPIAPNLFSVVATNTGSVGHAGSLIANVQTLTVADGGFVSASTIGSGDGGNVIINSDRISISGATPTGIASLVSVTTVGRLGNAGNANITTRELILQDSGLLNATSLGIGNAGNITVNASERIEIGGQLANLSHSFISSSVNFAPPAIQQALGLSNPLQGSAGNVILSTPTLALRNGSITVLNNGQGDAGKLQIEANSIFLDDGDILASTTNGSGGNINLKLTTALVARNNSQISASAQGGTGDGGNIALSVPILVGVENSDIVANAVLGNGGNINITTQGILGLVFRDRLTPENDITVSSELGISGDVEISSQSTTPDSGLVELPDGLVDNTSQITQGCVGNGDNAFIATGRGGIPVTPNEIISRERIWSDTRDLSDFVGQTQNQAGQAQGHAPTEINTWYINPNGQVELVAVNANQPAEQIYATCSAPALMSQNKSMI